jgi:transposase
LTYIRELYKVEQLAREAELSAAERGKLRAEKSTVHFNAFKKWCIEEYQKVLPKSAIGEAIAYALRRMGNMELYLVDGKIEIDNNLVENIIRPVAIGRKNYLFAGSHEAAQRSAMIYTFFALCKHHQINPEEWLTDVLNRIYLTKLSQLPQLLPPFWKPLK